MHERILDLVRFLRSEAGRDVPTRPLRVEIERLGGAPGFALAGNGWYPEYLAIEREDPASGPAVRHGRRLPAIDVPRGRHRVIHWTSDLDEPVATAEVALAEGELAVVRPGP